MATLAMRESLVKRLINQRVNWVIGGYENSILDGHRTEMPSKAEIFGEIYDEVMHTDAIEVAGGYIRIKKDIRFLGKEKIEQMISARLEKETELK